jgi:hypothetical protein
MLLGKTNLFVTPRILIHSADAFLRSTQTQNVCESKSARAAAAGSKKVPSAPAPLVGLRAAN